MASYTKYEVVYLAQFTKTRVVAAESREDAMKKAEEMERKFQKAFQKSDYILGDVEMVYAEELTPKYYTSQWQRDRSNYHVGD
jgi:alkanesulfonate monooxygenase SsuD/methylene tetrahydromethanopterin reductase-like flavin-dependent oxidoreductase (luciferase family)